jgi:hypothetical protein
MPTIETAANLQLTAGNYGLVRFEGGIGGAIAGDKVSARVAMMATRRGGFGENIITGNPSTICANLACARWSKSSRPTRSRCC